MTERQGVRVRSTAESALFYVGIPAVTLYPLGFLGVGIQLWRDPLFPYSRLDSVWVAVSMAPETTVIETGFRLLFLALVSTAFGIGTSVLVVRVLLLLGREPGEASAVLPGRRGWMLSLLLLLPVAVVALWYSVRINSGTDLALFVGFFAFSTAAGLVIGIVRWRSAEERWFESVLATYVAAILAALCLAASQTPLLPVVEIGADRDETRPCREVPADDVYVMLDRSDSFLYVYNDEGLLSLQETDAETLRFRECQEYLDRD